MKSELENILHKIVLAGVFLLPFLPLVVINGLFFPFITSKAFFFRLLVEIILIAWIILVIKWPEYRPRPSVLIWSVVAWVGVTVLASVFGVDIIRSVFSNFERMEGVITYLHLLAYFVVVATVLDTNRLWRYLFNTSIGVAWIIVFYGIFQLMGIYEINQGGVRLDATLGNAAYLASYMMFHVFIAGFMWLRSAGDKGRQYFYGISILAYFFILYNTATRGAVLGLIGGMVLAALLVVIFEKENKKLRKAAGGVVLAIIVFVGLFVGLKDTAFVQNSPVLGRFADISVTETTTKSRFLIWNMAWQGFKEKPILGWGPGNFRFVFDKYYSPEMYNQEQWFDRSHNIIFDWLIAGGVLGLASYLAIFGAFLYLLWFRQNTLSVTEKSVLTGLIAAYFFQNLFIFDNIVTYYLFFTILAFGYFSWSDSFNVKKGVRDIPPGLANGLIAGGMIVVLVGVYFSVVKPYDSANTLLRSLRSYSIGDIEESLRLLGDVTSSGLTGRTEAREQLVNLSVQALGNELLTNDQKEIFVQLATRQINKQIIDNPKDVRAYFFAGELMRNLGRYDEAVQYYNQALDLSPNKQSIMFNLAGTYVASGELDKALDIMQQTFYLEPTFDEARKRYVHLLFLSGRSDEAEELLLERFGTLAVNDNGLLNLYVSQGRYGLVSQIWQQRVESSPEKLDNWFSYAGSFLIQGDTTQAVYVLEQALDLFQQEDDVSKLEQGIKTIKDGSVRAIDLVQ